MVSLANANMHLTAIRQQAAWAVHILVQVSRMSDGTRRVMNIAEVTGMATAVVTLEKPGLSPEGKVGALCGDTLARQRSLSGEGSALEREW